ncbi:hypothetical protein DUT91_24755, partial [Phyllobacterium salinisoli]
MARDPNQTNDPVKFAQGRDVKEQPEATNNSGRDASRDVDGKPFANEHKHSTNISGGQNAQAAGIQIIPPADPLYLYQTYTLDVTVDQTHPEVWAVFWTSGAESPPPDEGKCGHTVIFDPDGLYQGYTPVGNFQGKMSIKAVGPNTDTTITIYAHSEDATPIGIADLKFLKAKASDNPPKTTLGLFTLDGPPLPAPGGTHLVKAVYTDDVGTPLPGEITWQLNNTSATSSTILSTNPTQTIDDGTTTNGIDQVAVQSVYRLIGCAILTATAPDGAKAQLSLAATQYGRGPSITIAPDETQQTLTATYSGAGTEVLWEAFPADQVQFTNRTTLVANGSTQNTITAKGDGPFTAYISASTLNEQTGTRDYGVLQLTLQGSVQHGIGITGTDPIPLYAAQTLTATNANPSDQMSDIYWSAVPSDP